MSRIALPNLRIGGLRQFSFGDVIYDRANLYPNLDLDFATNKNLTDNRSGKTSIVSFSRSAASSPGTYVDSQGLIKKSAVNLMFYSEQFDNPAWTKQANASISANQSLSPDGKQTADLLTEGVTSPNAIYQSKNVTAGTMYTASLYFKYVSGSQWWRFMFYDGGGNQNRVWFDALNGTIGQNGGQGTATFGSTTIENVGDDWFRISVSGIIATTTSYSQITCQTGDGSTSPAAGQLLVWGAQLEETDPALMGPSPYIKTTTQALCAPRFDHEPTSGNITTNFVKYSEMLDNTAWLKSSGGSVVANQAIAPDGSLTADEAVITSGAAIYQRYDSVISPGDIYTISVWLKADTNVQTKIGINGLTNGANNEGIIVNVTTEWQRFSFTKTLSADTGIYAAVAASGWTGAPGGTLSPHNVYVYGAQLEQSATAGPYVRTLAETRSISDANAESLGLLIEEQRENLAAYSQDPSSWSITGGTDIMQASADDILENSDGWKIQSNNTNPNIYVNRPNPVGSIVTCWAVVKKGSGATEANEFRVRDDTAGADKLRFEIDWDTNAITYTLGSSGVTVKEVANGWVKIIATVSWTSGNLLRYNIGFSSSPVSVGEYFYFSHAQIEIGSFPTSYIPTEGTTQTRYADVAAIENEDFSYTNLLSYSESFDVDWVASNATVQANAGTSPFGENTADLIYPTSTGSTRYVRQDGASGTGRFAFSVYAKASGKDKFFLYMLSTGTHGVAYFDLADESTSVVGGGTSTPTATIENVGDGWYRCTYLLGTSITLLTSQFSGFGPVDAKGSLNVTANGTDGVLFYGAQLTATEYPVDYVSTRNLLKDSQDFERSTWQLLASGTSQPVVNNDYAVAPDGTNTADKIDFGDTSASTGHYSVIYNNVPNLQVGENYKGSFWAKAATASDVGRKLYAYFETVIHEFTLTADWQRFEYYNAAALVSRNYVFGARGSSSLQPAFSALIWGAQLEPGVTKTDYYRTTDVVGKKYPWYEPTEGTTYMSNVEYLKVNGKRFFVIRNSSTGDRILDVLTGGTTTLRYFKTSDISSITIGLLTDPQSFALAYKLDDFNASLNGVLGGADTSTNQLLIPDSIQFGNLNGAQYFRGHIKRFIYFPRRIKDSNLILMTE